MRRSSSSPPSKKQQGVCQAMRKDVSKEMRLMLQSGPTRKAQCVFKSLRSTASEKREGAGRTGRAEIQLDRKGMENQ